MQPLYCILAALAIRISFQKRRRKACASQTAQQFLLARRAVLWRVPLTWSDGMDKNPGHCAQPGETYSLESFLEHK